MATVKFSMLMLWAVCLFAVSVRGMSKRSDDPLLSLEAVVQQQAVTIQQQAATIQQLQASLASMKASVEARLTSLETSDHQQTSIIQKLDTRVSFAARMSHSSITIGSINAPIVFDAVDLNLGGAYSQHTGAFTAPVSGVYVFYSQLMNDQTHGAMQWGIYKSGSVVCLNHLDTLGAPWDKSSCETTIHLQNGDVVQIHPLILGTSEQLIGGNFCAFSGFLLYAD